MIPAIALVVVRGGVAYDYAPPHVLCEIVDIDNIKAGDAPPQFLANLGFEELAQKAGLVRGEDFTIEGDPNPNCTLCDGTGKAIDWNYEKCPCPGACTPGWGNPKP